MRIGADVACVGLVLAFVSGCESESPPAVAAKAAKPEATSVPARWISVQRDNAVELRPKSELTTGGTILDMVHDERHLYAATAHGTLDIFDLATDKRIRQLRFPKIRNYYDEEFAPKVYSVDVVPSSKTIVLIVETPGGGRRLMAETGGVLRTIISEERKLALSKVRCISESKGLAASVGSEAFLFNIDDGGIEYTADLGMGSFTDFALNQSRDIAAFASEGGSVPLLDVKGGTVLRTLGGGNVDKVFGVDFRANKVVTGGQDRRLSIYDVGTMGVDRIRTEFFVYGVGLSPNGQRVAYTANEASDIAIVDLISEEQLYLMKGHRAAPHSLLFLDEEHLVSAGDENRILRWSFG